MRAEPAVQPSSCAKHPHNSPSRQLCLRDQVGVQPGFLRDTPACDHPPCSAKCFQRAVRFRGGERFGQELQNHVRAQTVFCILCQPNVASPLLAHCPQRIERGSFQLFSLWFGTACKSYGKTEVRIPPQNAVLDSLDKSS